VNSTYGERAWRCHLNPAGTATHHHGIAFADSGIADCAQRGTPPNPLRSRFQGENITVA